MKFNEDQIVQLLSAFWVQANLPDNSPSNVEAIAHSYCLMLISLRLKVRIPAYNCICFQFGFYHSMLSLLLDKCVVYNCSVDQWFA